MRPSFTEPPRAACAVVQTPDGRVLGLRRPDGWVLPGGSVEPGENPRAAATREVREETGVAVQLHPVPVEQTRSTVFYVAMFHDAARMAGSREGVPGWTSWAELGRHPRYGAVARRIAYKLGRGPRA